MPLSITLSISAAASRDNNPGDEVKALVNTLKTNVIGLGNYINTINRELNTLAGNTRGSLDTLTQQVGDLAADLKTVEGEVAELKLTSGSGSAAEVTLGNGGLVSSSLRTEVAGLSTKLYTLKTNVFEINGELTTIKNGLESLNNVVTSVDVGMKTLEDKLSSSEDEDASIKTDISTLRSGQSTRQNIFLQIFLHFYICIVCRITPGVQACLV